MTLRSKYQKYIKKYKERLKLKKEYTKTKEEYMEAGKKLHERIEQELYVGTPVVATPDGEINPYKSKSTTTGYTSTSAYETFLKRGYANAPAWMKETPVRPIDIYTGQSAEDLSKAIDYKKKKKIIDVDEEEEDEWLILN